MLKNELFLLKKFVVAMTIKKEKPDSKLTF
jgi:hypothetical protein